MPNIEITDHHGHHFLWIDDECWMWDFGSEVEAQQELADKARGDVLVAGYGLGIIQLILVDMGHRVLTAEEHSEVLSENRRIFGAVHGHVIVKDFFNLDEDYPKFDTVIGDIWIDVAPKHLPIWQAFHKKASKLLKPEGQVLAWGEECFKVWEAQL